MAKNLEKKTTELKRVEEQIKIISLAVEKSNEGIALADLDGNLEYLNHNFAKMHGYSPEELLGRHLSVFHTSDQMPLVNAANQKTKKTGSFIGEIWHVRRDATVFPGLMCNSLLRDESCNPIGIIATLRDITDLNLTNKRMQASEERFRELFNHMNSGAAIYEAKDNGNDFILKDVNRVGERIGNVKKEDLLGKSVLKIFPEVKEFGLFDIFKRVWETGSSEYLPISFYPAEEVGSWIENFVYKLPSGEIVVIYNDVTDRKQDRKALQKSEKRFRELTELLPEGIFEMDLNYNLTFLNRSALEHFRYTQQDVDQGLNGFDMFVPEDRQRAMGNTQKILQGGKLGLIQYTALRSDGSSFPVMLHSAPIYCKDKPIGLRGIIIDITERVKSEETLQESENRYREIFDNSPLGIFRSTFSGQFLVANPAFARCLGFDTPEELLQSVSNIGDIYVDPRDREELKRVLQKLGFLIDYEIHLKDRVRGDCWKSIYARPIYNEAGEPEYIDGFSIDVTKHKWTELALIERNKELKNKTHEIEEVNTALKVLLKCKDQDQKDFEEKIVANVKKLVLPYIEKLNNSRLNDRQMAYLNIIRSNLEDVISPYLHHLSLKSSNLTPREIQIAELVKHGKTTKEIANLLNCSTGTIDFHRNNLRKKLGLRNTKKNLRSFLLSLK